MADEPYLFEIEGYCPICENETTFRATGKWFRADLRCLSCPNGSVPRERALAVILKKEMPNWHDLVIHESSPMERGLSMMLRAAPGYLATQFFAEKPFGAIVNGWRNENLERLTFADETFDLCITQDVLEHVFSPRAVFQEVFRTLKPGGLFISTFPIRKAQADACIVRASLKDDKSIQYHRPAEYHGNPVDKQGALVTIDYGYDVHQAISYWTEFDVCIYRFADRRHGILGEYTDVVACRKPLEVRLHVRALRDRSSDLHSEAS